MASQIFGNLLKCYLQDFELAVLSTIWKKPCLQDKWLNKQHTINSGYQAYVPITQSGKKYALNKMYALNKQVSKYVVMPFSNNASTFSFVLTGYGFMLPCMRFVHLALRDHSTTDYTRYSQTVAWC